MSKLREAAEQYLQLRRDLGCKLRETGRLLQRLPGLCRTGRGFPCHHGPGTPLGPATRRASSRRPGPRASAWCGVSPPGSAPRIDARKCRPPACCPAVIVRKRPYIYSDAEIRDLVRAAGQTRFGRGAEGPHLRDDLRIARGHRHARQRSAWHSIGRTWIWTKGSCGSGGRSSASLGSWRSMTPPARSSPITPARGTGSSADRPRRPSSSPKAATA